MLDLLFKVWYIVIVLPFLILLEGNKKFQKFLKEKDIYSHWDIWHSFIVILIILIIVLWTIGYH